MTDAERFLGDRVALYCGDCRDVLAQLDENSIDSCVTDLALGIAAEHLVCADLLLNGWRAFIADQNCPYDVAVDIKGRLIRLQVKATRCQRAIQQRGNSKDVPAYMWHVRRAGKGGKRLYSAADFDLLALVAIDIRKIAYFGPDHVRQTVHIRPPGTNGGKQFDQYDFRRALGLLVKP
jgi:hypothetical protein